ncbi:MAG TPA: MBL fold metallo-hydrolase [Chondromyces sp.]|nr:MBL fold metallo-hydrolase [Chondromyces sp.]
MRQNGFRRAWGRLQGARVSLEDVGRGVVHVRMRTFGARLLGMDVSAYLVGPILVDTGFAYVREPLLAALAGARIEAVCCTHCHEDHTGNAAAVAVRCGCPVYLRRAASLWEEGVRSLAPYRLVWWGRVEPFEPEEMPEVVEAGGRRLEAVPAGGHSQTQVALFDAATGDVFTGDLFVSPGATAILIWGDPWREAASLRRVAALRPRRMLTGHGLILDDPAPLLEAKAARIEAAARRAVELAGEGLAPRRIVRRVFPRGGFKDRFFELLTSREFSRLNFVRAAIRCAPSHPSSR